jgi:uncharacterized membrane protein YkoI
VTRLLLCLVILAVSLAFYPALAAKRLTVDDVRDMAFAKGVVTIKEIELDDGVWDVEGRDASGHKIKIEVDARSGEIVKIKRK